MKKLLIPVSILLAATTALTSCKKDDDGKSRHDMFVGNWKTYQSGDDANGNGIWDANEKKTDSSGVATVTLNTDGSGTAVGNLMGTPITLPLNWSLQNNDNDIRLITTFLGSADTAVQNIVSIDESTFVLKDPSQNPVFFTSFNKQ